MLSLTPSFYSLIPETPREDLLKDYLAFLEKRNGAIDPKHPYPHREKWLASANASSVRHQGELDVETFERGYRQFNPKAEMPAALVALLSLVKVNATEAYGVEAVSKRRHRAPAGPEMFDNIERLVVQEETYHTRILLGATAQFGLAAPRGAWEPSLPLKVFIGSLAYVPRGLFVPMALGSEIGGVFTFVWMLHKVRELFRDEPSLRESLEERLIEILIDEIGHIAFNRLSAGPKGIYAARKLAPLVAAGTNGNLPEFLWLGWTAQTPKGVEKFDYLSVPEEVRRRAFFV